MTLETLDRHLARWMRTHGHTLLRFGLGLVFVWFGAPKLVPGLSPADALVRATVTCCDPTWFVPLLGTVEMLIGLCLWNRRWLRFGLVLMAGHMVGAALPLFTLPEIAWKAFPVATLEGQYILKNVVLIAGAIVLGGAAYGDAEAARRPVRRWTERGTKRGAERGTQRGTERVAGETTGYDPRAKRFFKPASTARAPRPRARA
jgi:uncharacterized membrane protein YkgB